MKPISLTLVDIGPYRGSPVTIDFTVLDRLFLIGGDTGAGKTTIFDAICFALYGEPLGTRDDATLRSELATDGEASSVTFEWKSGDVRYRVHRTTPFDRTTSRGTSRQPQSVTLKRLDPGATEWEPYRLNATDTNKKIATEIVRLSHAEFSKILVLPQGQFQQFLEMDTAKREDILNKLFPTQRHKEIAALAKRDAEVFDKAIKACAAQLLEAGRELDPSTVNAELARLDAELSSAIETERVAREAAKIAHTERERGVDLAQKFALFVQEKRALSALEETRTHVAEREEAIVRSRRAEPVLALVRSRDERRRLREKIVAELIHTRAESAALATQRIAVEAEVARLPERRKANETRVSDVTRLAHRIDDLSDLDRARADLKAARKRYRSMLDELAPLEAAEVRATLARAALDPLEAERETIRTAIAASTDRATNLAKLEGDAKTLAAWLKDEERLRETIRESRRSAEAAIADEAALNRALAAARARAEAQAARLLAAALRDGEACPVCGSEEHPKPAHGPDADDDVRARVQSAEAALEAARKVTQQSRELERAHSTRLEERSEMARDAETRLESAGFRTISAWQDERREAGAELAALRARDAAITSELSSRQAIEERLRTAQRGRADLESQLAALKTEGERLGSEESARNSKLGGVVDAEAERRACEAQRETIELERKREEQAMDALVRQDRELDVTAQKHALLIERLSGEKASADDEISALVERVRDAVISLGFGDEKAAVDAVLHPERLASEQRDIDEHRGKLRATEGRLEVLHAQIGDRTEPDLAGLEASERQAELTLATLSASREDVARMRASLSSRAARYTELFEELGRLQEKSAISRRISGDLNGESGVKQSFSTFILSYWLERVLDRGTSRLTKLSEGRYAFVIDASQAAKNKRFGLEIDVWDAYSGTKRSVRSLSGGEKFMASLSLALGLSDVIQERAGGIELDTLFIDEGFGSLDASALDHAIAAIEEVGAHRSVGVISHVEALKKAIPCQLRVTKGPAGSSISMVGARSPHRS